MTQVGGYNVAMLPPGNHPYSLFSHDSPWEITCDGVMYIEQILRCPTHGSHLTNYGLYTSISPYILRSKMFYMSGFCSSACRIISPTRGRL